MKEFRIRFSDKQNRKKFFLELKSRTECMNYLELSATLKIPVGRLRLYANGARSIPKETLDKWCNEFSINLDQYGHKTADMGDFYKEAAKQGVEVLKQKYGEDWAKITGKRSMEKLRKTLKSPEMRKKWRSAVENSLRNKFGENFYKEMGKLGGRKSIEVTDKEELEKRLKGMFRKSFKNKIKFDGMAFRSLKEVEVAKVLVSKGIQFDYEKELFGFYPDFVFDKIIIEVVGFDWKPHIERTVHKIKLFNQKGFTVVVYTYPNMAKYFDNLPVKIALHESDLINILGYNRG